MCPHHIFWPGVAPGETSENAELKITDQQWLILSWDAYRIREVAKMLGVKGFAVKTQFIHRRTQDFKWRGFTGVDQEFLKRKPSQGVWDENPSAGSRDSLNSIFVQTHNFKNPKIQWGLNCKKVLTAKPLPPILWLTFEITSIRYLSGPSVSFHLTRMFFIANKCHWTVILIAMNGSVAQWLGRWTCGRRSQPGSRCTVECNLGQVVHTHCPAPLVLQPYDAI